MTVCWMLDALFQMSPQLINILHRILIDPLLYHSQDSVIYVLKCGTLDGLGLGDIIDNTRN